MGFWKGVCSFCGAVACGVACIATGGLAAPAVLGYSAVAGGLGFLIGDKADKEAEEKERRLMQDQKYKEAKEEINNQLKINDQIKGQLLDIIGKLNGTIPRQPNETDEHLNTQFAILTGNLRNGENRLTQLTSELDKLRKELSGVNSLMSLLGLDKLSFTDKVMVVGGITLIIFLLKG